jgi:integrase
MTSVKLQFIHEFRDRHGKVRRYFRRPGHKLMPLPGLPGSAEFNRAYEEALAGASRVEIGIGRTRAGSIAAMVVGYMGTAAFHKLAPASKQQYRRILEGLRCEHGDRSIATLERRHVAIMVDAMAKHPAAARDFLRCLRLLIQYAITIGIRPDDPTAGVRVRLPKSDGFKIWTEEDIAAFEAAYPVGSKPRLALALLLETGLRCADVVRVGRHNVRDGVLRIVQQKNGIPIANPVTAKLAEAINAAAPADHLVFLLNERGAAFTARAFGKWFSAQCDRIGLDRLSPHGVRKLAATRMAERGATAHELMAFFGWASIKEAERYTRRVDRERLARNAVERTNQQRQLANLPAGNGKPAEKGR